MRTLSYGNLVTTENYLADGSGAGTVSRNDIQQGTMTWNANQQGTITLSSGSSTYSASRYYAPGRNALALDGGYVGLASVLTGVATSFTYEFWARPRATHQNDGQTTSGVGGTSGQHYVWDPLRGPTGKAGVGVSMGTNGISVYEHAVNYMPAKLVYPTTLSGWTHVAVVYKNNQPSLYVNGVFAKTGYSGGGRTAVACYGFGRNYWGGFSGDLDEMRVWNYDRSASQIQADMNRSLTGTEPGLVSYWPCNEGSGTILNDMSPTARQIPFSGTVNWTTR